ncbi:M14 family metallopeptidase [Mucilaginibacter koreensis]
MKYKFYATILLAGSLLGNAKAQNIPTPKQHFGFTIGDDYHLANFIQTEAYFKKLAASARTKYVDIGQTEEGRHQFMLIVSSPENIKQLDKYKRIAQQLAHAENLTDAQARALADQGKSVVWIDGGLHATETVGIHQLILTAYQLVTRNDAETKHILDNTIILMVHANPDGQELVSKWYMQEKDSTKRNMNVPRLWQKYIGHDNNRDFFMMNMKESQNITRQQYIEWLPQIVYNHHQTGPAGSVVAGPPYRDPYNYVYDPLLVTSIDAVGAAMNNRLNAENKPGYTQRSGTSFSTWWNGGLRTAPYFHNMVGLLTEIIGSPTPSSIPLVPERLIPNGATPNPVAPQPWHFRQSIDYSVSLNYAVLNYATHMRQDLLFNIYRMGKNSIERGNRDNWTLSPKRIDSINRAFKSDTSSRQTANGAFRNAGVPVKFYDKVLKDPTLRDARGYIIPSDQTDFPTAVKFINALIRSGIVVQQATASFSVGGKSYPAGSYVVKTNQAFRPHVLDMFEPQDHPNDFQYPGGPPVRPYDITGWTLAYQMGVKFDRVLEGFDGPFKRINYGDLQKPPVQPFAASVNGYYFNAGANNSFIAVNDLLKAGKSVYRVNGNTAGLGSGAFYVSTDNEVNNILRNASATLGLKITASPAVPGNLEKIVPARIALWDTYGGSMPSGWIRWLMEQYKFPFQVMYTQDIDAGNLKDKYDVIVFSSGSIPASGGRSGTNEGSNRTSNLPAEYQRMVGRISAEKSVPKLKAFLEAGGHIVTIGTSANLAYHLNLPVQNALVEKTTSGQGRPLSADKFYVPGSILQASVDTGQTANWGMNTTADVDYDTSPVFKLKPGADAKNIIPLLTFSSATPLLSGWAWGQSYLNHTIAAFEAPIGKGKLDVFGPEITFRGQAQGTFKLLFNQLYLLNTK